MLLRPAVLLQPVLMVQQTGPPCRCNWAGGRCVLARNDCRSPEAVDDALREQHILKCKQLPPCSLNSGY